MEKNLIPFDDDGKSARNNILIGVRAPFSLKKEKALFFLKVQVKMTRVKTLIDLRS